MATILTKKSDTASAVPLAADLTNATGGAELAVNATDKRLFSKTSGGTVVELGTNPSSLTLPNGTANGLAFLNASKVVTSNSIIGFDGTNIKVATSGITANSYLSGLALTFDRNADNTISAAGGASSNLVLGADNVLKFNAAGSEGMRLTSTGLGIGTSSPAYKLDVSGGIRSNSIKVGTTQDIITSGMWYQSSSSQLKWSPPSGGFGWNNNANAVELMALTDSGNLGLGVTPSAWAGFPALQFAQGFSLSQGGLGVNTYYNAGFKYIVNGAATLYQPGSGAHLWYTAASGTAGNAITFTQAMTLDASGNLLVGTTSGSYRINVTGADNVALFNSSGTAPYIGFAAAGTRSAYIQSDNSAGLLLVNERNTPMAFYTNNTERARIDSSGNLLVGTTTTTSGARLVVKGSGTTSATYNIYSTNSAGSIVFATEDGGTTYTGTLGNSPYNNTTGSAANMVVNAAGVLLRSTSSLKYKKDVQSATHGLAEVLKLRPVTYKGKSETDGNRVFGGLIAEEVHSAGLTEFVQYAEDGTPDALAYGNMVSLCIKAIQELKAEFDAYKASHP